METVDISLLVVLVGLVVSTCSIAAFFLGRKKEATYDGQKSGAIETDIKNISRQVDEMKTSFDRMNLKMDTVDEKRECEYRTMLVSVTELSASYESLHKRVDTIEQKIDFIQEK